MGDVLNQVRAKLELEGRNAADVKRRVVTAFTKIAGKDSFKNPAFPLPRPPLAVRVV